MKNLETLGKITWNKIKIGEVFAYNGCWIIGVKVDEENAMYLADDSHRWNPNIGKVIKNNKKEGRIFGTLCIYWAFTWEFAVSIDPFDHLYELPKWVQRLYKEE